MPTLSLTKNYADSTLLLADDFDVFLDELEVFLNTTKINNDNIQNDGITGSTKILSASISTAKILNANVTTAKIASEAITTDKIAATNVTTAKLATGAVTAAKIAASAVTTAKILDSNVTKAKLRSANYSKSVAASGTASPGSSALIGAVSLTTTGRPVMIFLEAGSTTYDSYVGVLNIDSGYSASAPNTTAATLGILFYRGASIISAQEVKAGWIPSFVNFGNPAYVIPGYLKVPPGSFCFIEQPAAGTYTYSVYADSNNTARNVNWANVRVVAVEL